MVLDNKDSAKFCSKHGVSLEAVPEPVEPKNSNSKIIIAVLIAVIVILAVSIGYFALGNNAWGLVPKFNQLQEIQAVQILLVEAVMITLSKLIHSNFFIFSSI